MRQSRPVVPLAHIRTIGYGNRGWSYPRYLLAGQTRALSSYDQPESLKDTGEGFTSVSGGVVTSRSRVGLQEPSMTRQGRVSAQYDSAPNASIWQGSWNPRWSGPYGVVQSGAPGNMMARPMHQPLFANFNPNAMGTKEPMRATIYNPYPASGAIYPKAI